MQMLQNSKKGTNSNAPRTPISIMYSLRQKGVSYPAILTSPEMKKGALIYLAPDDLNALV